MNAAIPRMPKLVPGLYDLPLTRELRQALDQLEAKRFAAKTDSPDPADAHELLGRHVATLVRQILQAFRGDDPLTRQAEICNEVLAALQQGRDDLDGDLLEIPAQRLAAICPLDGLRNAPPADPEIPLSQSDLLVNTRGEPNR